MPIRYSSVVGGSSGSGFNLDIGSSGNTTFVFDEPQPAGGYSITSQLADPTIEFYAIAEDGSLAGYTNTKALTASQDFAKMVIYGATNNDLITFEFKPTTLPTSNGDQDSGAAPFITSISDTTLININDTTIITGGNFATDVTVTFTGTDSVVRNPKSIVRTDSTQLIVTRPDDFPDDYSPYTISISNPGIPNSTIVQYTANVSAGSGPVWATSSGSLGDFSEESQISVTIVATDADGGAVTYSISSGLLPTGLTLNSATGEISGTSTEIGLATFTVDATDDGGNVSSRTFEISIYALVNATGGSVQNIGGYRIHTFNSNGTLSVSKGGEIEYLVVAGGGGSGWDVGGGGGAGGMLTGVIPITTGSHSITVGGGGTGATGGSVHATNGIDSSISTLVVASGGGYGGNWNGTTAVYRNGNNGGSGGGGGGWQQTGPAGLGTPGQGNDGGTGGGGTNWTGGGGGGAGGAGSNSNTSSFAAGGAGLASSISGSSVTYASGGRGANDNTVFSAAASNTGNGADGGGYNNGNNGNTGGSGIVIIRYLI